MFKPHSIDVQALCFRQLDQSGGLTIFEMVY